jgi:DNA-binding MarR family transcriptional regulator
VTISQVVASSSDTVPQRLCMVNSGAFAIGENMDIERILSDLKKERDRLTRAIDALEDKTRVRAVRRSKRVSARRRKRRLTPEGRKRLSEMMKKRWAERRRKAA